MSHETAVKNNEERGGAVPWWGVLLLVGLGAAIYGYTALHTTHSSSDVDREITAKYAARMAKEGVKSITVGQTNVGKHTGPITNALVALSKMDISTYVPTNVPNFVYFTATLKQDDGGPTVEVSYQGTNFRPDAPQPTEEQATEAIGADIAFILAGLEQLPRHKP